ncbi:MAG: DUF11 domain-containing protein [Pyrinomonadaceae bacterium]|nr:DUF11 domain-containing protein [Pyrinomonadaceae bacterium]
MKSFSPPPPSFGSLRVFTASLLSFLMLVTPLATLAAPVNLPVAPQPSTTTAADTNRQPVQEARAAAQSFDLRNSVFAGFVAPLAPVGGPVTANMQDIFTDPDNDGADKGQTITYQTTITNVQGSQLTGVEFQDTPDANTTLVNGSIHASPVAFDDTYNWVCNTQLDTSARSLPSITANDVAINPAGGTDTFNLNTTPTVAPTKGSVTLSSNGHFVYTPNVGATGSDTFSYAITNSSDASLVGTGTVTINMPTCVWYLQGGASGDGRSNTPSGNPATISGLANATTDIFYVFSSGNTLNGPFTLDNSQQLLGQGVALQLTLGGTPTTLFNASTTPTIASSASGNAVTLGTGNTLNGFNIGTTSGFAISGSNVGTLSVSNVSINTTGGGLDLTGVSTPTVNVALGSLTASGGTNNVKLSGLNGTINLGSSGALTGTNSGTAFLVSGGGATISYGGTVSQSNAQKVVDIANTTGGSVTFSNTVTGTSNCTGVNLNTNTGNVSFTTLNLGTSGTRLGSTAVTITGGSGTKSLGTVSIFTTSGSGTGISSSNSTGAVTVTGGDVNSAGAPALNIVGVSNVSTTPVNLVFTSVSANGGQRGIVLTNVSSSGGGGLTVNGTGSTGGSGGTIQNTTNNGIQLTTAVNVTLKNMNLTNNATTQTATNNQCGNNLVAGDTTLCVANLYLNSVTTVSLTNLSVTGSAQEGIAGTSVSGFTLANSSITGNGGEDYENGLLFKNLTGTVSITNTTVQNNFSRQSHIYNSAGTLTLNVTGSTFGRNVAPGVSSQQGMLLELAGTSTSSIDIGTSTFIKNGNGNGLAVAVTGSANVGTAGTHSSLHNSTNLSENAAHVFISNSGSGDVYFDVMNNSAMTKAGLQSIDYFSNSSSAAGSLTGIIQGNTIGTSGSLGSACNRAVTGGGCDGMTLDKDLAGSMSLRIQGNTIQQVETNGIALGSTQSNTLDATIIGNTIREPGNTAGINSQGNAMLFNVGANSGSTTTACLNIGVSPNQNTIQDTASKTWDINGSAAAIYLNTKNSTTTRLPGMGGSGAAAAQTFITGNNTFNLVGGASPVLASVFNGSQITGGAACTTPLLLAEGGVEALINTPSILSNFDLASSQNNSSLEAGAFVSNESGATINIAPAANMVAGELTQSQLDAIVNAAIERWEATGLTAEQRATLRSIRFEVANLSSSYLGEATGSRIQVDVDAGGKGWYIGADAASDMVFSHVVSSTRRYTEATAAPAGRIDLLTVISHEMGHRLRLDDTYAEKDRDNLMYGYLTMGERRLPAQGQAAGAHANNLSGSHFIALSNNEGAKKQAGNKSNALNSATTLQPQPLPPAPVDVVIGTLPTGKAVTIKFQVTVNNSLTPASTTSVQTQGSVLVTGFANTPTNDPDTVAADDATVTPLARTDVAVTSVTDGLTSTTPGSTLSYTINYSNPGRAATGVQLTETVPTGTTFNAAGSDAGWTETPSGSGIYKLTVGSLAHSANGSKVFAVTVNNPAPAGLNNISNTASIADDGAYEPDVDTSNNSASDTNTVLNAAPAFGTFTKSDGVTSTTPGSTLTYTINYTNTGNQDATGVVLTDTVPTGTTFNAGASTAGWTETPSGSGIYKLTVGAVAGGGGTGSATFVVVVNNPVAAGLANIVNNASITDDGTNSPSAVTANASDTDTLNAVPDLALTKTPDVANTSAGQTITYTLNYSNSGTQGATGVVLTETVPANTVYNAVATPGWTCTPVAGAAGATCTKTVGALAGGGGSGSTTFAVTVVSPVPGGTTQITNVATIADDNANGADANNANNSTGNVNTAVCASTATVTNTADSGSGSLRDAITNICPGGTITITATGTIQLASALPDIDKNMTINGPGANQLEIKGKIATVGDPTEYRVFNITSAVTDTKINDLTISNGGDATGGGGIKNAGQIFLNRVTVKNNTTTSTGGGILNSGVVNLNNSTVSNNVASLQGGGIYNTGDMGIGNTTISTNTANVAGVGLGGGFYNATTINNVIFNNVTIANNSADASGGGVYNASGTIRMDNTIAANNTATASPDLSGAGTFQSDDYNLVENSTVVFTGTTAHNITGVDPVLGGLANNGGPTYTHALLDGSPAIDKGKTNKTTDQRNFTRPVDNPNVANVSVSGADGDDIGAYEASAPSDAPDLDAASDTGASDTDNITNDNTPSFTITGVTNGATVDLLLDGNPIPVVSGVAAGTSIQLVVPNGTPVADGMHTFTARQTVNGGTSPVSAGLSVTIDTVAPTINIGAPSVSSANASIGTVTYTVTYGGADAVTLADINVAVNTSGTATATAGVSGSGTVTRTVTLSSLSGTGTLGISIATGTASDTAGNTAGAAGPSATFTVDADPPTVAMNSAAGDPTSTSPIPVTVTFSESVTGFTSGDITAGNGTVSNFAGSGANYTFDLVPTGQGLVTADIGAGVAQDGAGNGNTAATQFSRTYDSDAPSVSMSSVITNPTNTSPIPVTVTFSESVTGFTSGDIVAGNGTVSNFAGSGANYTFDLVPTGQGLVTADIGAGVAQDGAGNSNTAATQFSRTYDTVGPTVTINQASTQADPVTNAATINFTVVFNEPVTGFDSADVSFSGAGATTATVTEIAPMDDTTYNVAITGMNTSGHVTASVNANAAQDGAGNLSAASTSTDNDVLNQQDTATTFEVNSTDDTDDGACAPFGTGNGCTLREAIKAANLDGGAAETITFAPALTSGGAALITLTGSPLPEITDSVTIVGPTDNTLTIDGGSTSGIFEIAASVTVNISNVTVKNGDSGGNGGGIRNSGTLTLDKVTVADNNANGSLGGGIYNDTGATLTITNSTIDGNTAQGGHGGGIYNLGTLTIRNSTLSNNYAKLAAGVGGDGGAIDSDGGTLTIYNSTISANKADGGGGGIHHCGNSTGVLLNVTITGNRSDNDNALPGEGGGIEQVSSNSIALRNTIVAGNFKGTGATADDLSGATFDTQNSLIQTPGTATINDLGGNILNQNPQLGALALNGGLTKTHLLLPGSQAINAGSNTLTNAAVPALTTDQRGAGFPRFVGTVDMGAVEVNYSISATAGTPQSAVIGNAFATQLAATVTESGNTVSGVSVTFTAPGAGASGIFAASSTVTTDVNGVATAPIFTANAIAGGPYNVTASLTGGSPSTNFALTNTKADQMITFGPLAGKTFGDAPFMVNATGGGSSSPVTFSSTTPGICSVSGNTVTILGAGLCTINASQAGDGNFNAAPDVPQSFTVAKANSTTTVTVSNATFDNNPHGGTAAATGAGGLNQSLTVSYVGRNGTVYGPSTTAPTNAGDYTASATFAGDANHNGSNDSKDFSIGKANQTVTFGALSNKVFGDADFAVSATASSGLSVTFSAVGACTVTGNMVHITGAGDCTITATQSGNANFNSASTQQGFSIGKAVTSTTITSSANPSGLGQNVTFTATVNATGVTPTGTVQFKVDGVNAGAPVALNGSGAASFSTNTLTAGNHSITADYSGGANFTANTGTLAGGQQVGIQTTVSVNDVTVTEGNSGTTNAVFTVSLSAASSVAVTVDFATADGVGPNGATAPSDYQTATGQLTFNIGETSKTVTVLVNGDTSNEPNETFTLNLSNPQNVNLADAQGVGTITNDDAPGVQFAQSTYNISEALNNTPQGFTSLAVDVVRTGDTSLPATVKYITSDNSGGNECDQNNTGFASQRCDYILVGATLRFAAGETTKTINIPIVNDRYVEPSEQFSIELFNPMGTSLGLNSQALVTIQDDDTVAPTGLTNPYLANSFFVRQNYLDNLGRDADAAGFTDWLNTLNNCGPQQGFLGAPLNCDRAHVAHGFFGSVEFTNSGFLIHRLFEVGMGRLPLYREFIPDMATLSGFNIPPAVQQQNIQDYLQDFTSKPEFINRFSDALLPSQAATLIQKLEQAAGVTLPATATTLPGQPQQYGRQELINLRAAGTLSVGQTLKAFVEQQLVYDKYFTRGEVTMLYFAYLRRDPNLNDPNLIGWNDWVDVFTNGKPGQGIGPRDIHHLMFGFIYSVEYRKRFGAP